jgi:hypothetical protein
MLSPRERAVEAEAFAGRRLTDRLLGLPHSTSYLGLRTRQPSASYRPAVRAASKIFSGSRFARSSSVKKREKCWPFDGADLRPSPIEERKQHLAWALRGQHHGIAINATYNGDGGVIYQHACTLGCEGIVSKRLGSPYRAGRTDQWLKMKNPHAPAVRREREIDWAKR